MAREIIHCQIGQCGNQVGLEFWETIRKEHHVNISGRLGAARSESASYSDNLNVYFRDTSDDSAENRKLVPRALLIDLEPSVLDMMMSTPVGELLCQSNMLFGSRGTGNNWASGHYSAGTEVIDEIRSKVRKEVEMCNCLQGFQICHSLGGGTGSGLGTLLLMKLRDDYPDRINCTYSVYPTPYVSDVVVEPYNAILSTHQLLEYSDETFVIDNEALYNITCNVLLQHEPRYSDMNWVVSQAMAGVTASLRFPGQLNGDLRKMGLNLVPFPRLHFFLLSHSPLVTPSQRSNKVQLTTREITDNVWRESHFLANVRADDGLYITANLTYRGDVAAYDVEHDAARVQSSPEALTSDFVDWIPNNLKTSMVKASAPDTERSATMVANTTAMKRVFQRVLLQFGRMYKRKAFLHWYTDEGMNVLEFEEAERNVKDLVTEYQDKQDAVVVRAEEEDDCTGGDDFGSESGTSEMFLSDGSFTF